MNRNQQIIRTSLIGILSNVLLASFKAVVGFLAGSIAIVMDAVNNLSDVFSSVVTIIGTRYSARPADRKHPFGHGRIEYLSAIVIAVFVIAAGITSLIESGKKVLHPTTPEYTTVTLTVIITAIVVKLILGRYVKSTGERLQSDALIASGADATFDAVVTLGTLVSAVIMLVWHFSIDGILGVLISLLIIKAGIEILASPVNQILGTRISQELITNIKDEVKTFDGVCGVFDVIMHTYGPDTIIGSLHISVLDTTSAIEIHKLTHRISHRLMEKFGIIATIGIYAINSGDNLTTQLQQQVMEMTAECPDICQAHGFFLDTETRTISLDIIPEDGVKEKEGLLKRYLKNLQETFPDYHFSIIIDNNYSD
ncbi:cation diffusion facilitator family transporter [Prevotella sp. S7 MS 2]|uniref:cation diffusion facilitator family transporter n=1 Tax=Prevotella sp. S7 MS 2 TaxID=1287488 RepID=UPI0005133B71|nr:cation diffusion facilitator family transporter [Prevotella sp. S7 MS 2]KGI59990.1 cation diffusion facilitator family transporter [Prevotella sp. S7 MS 2]